MSLSCPLCRLNEIEEFHRDENRAYWQCENCQFVYVPVEDHLSKLDEKAVYDFHENSPDDLAYRSFLSRLADPLLQQIAPNSFGLDFGSGPGPTLSVMLEEAGHRVKIYDPFYADDSTVFDLEYDFITATEVVEHLRDPGMEFQRLWECLKPGGTLGVMTQLLTDPSMFPTWHYIRDPTHIGFYSLACFEWLAEFLDADFKHVAKNVILFFKRDSETF